MTLADWLQRIETMHPAEIEMGLERVSIVAQALSLLQPRAKVITVAGTNGKGSTVATLEALLLASGVRVGANTSPHLLRFNERIRVDGKEISDTALIDAFETIETMRASLNIDLTFFEFTTLAALMCFDREAVDVILLEVGLGGRMDASNIIDANIAVVTNIAVDHEAWLGSDREVIAPEKAGIARHGRAVVCADFDPPKSLGASFASIGAKPYWISHQFGYLDQVYFWRQSDANVVRQPIKTTPLSAEALATSLQVMALANIPLPRDLDNVVASISLSGRFQRLAYQNCRLLLDVAHNPASAHRLTQRVMREYPDTQVSVLFGSMADKDIDGVIDALSPMVNGRWFVTNLNVIRAQSTHNIAEQLSSHAITSVSEYTLLGQALNDAIDCLTPEDLLVVCGSFFTVAETMAQIACIGES